MRQDRSPICAAGRFPHSGRPAVAGFAQLAAPPILAAQQACTDLHSWPLPPFSPLLAAQQACSHLHSWPLPPFFEIPLLAETL